MKRSLLAAAAALLMATGTQTAHAASASDYRHLQTSGYWSTFVTTTSDNRTPMCGMRASFGNNGIVEGVLLVKLVKNDQNFRVQAFKSGWRIPDGTAIPLSLTFDNSQPFTATGSGVLSGDLNYVEFYIATGFSKDFLSLFAEANKMTLTFTEGSERPWTTDMRGSREAVQSFAQCITYISDRSSSSTQPYGKPQVTQPFGKPTPSQPFGGQPAQPSRPVKREDGSI